MLVYFQKRKLTLKERTPDGFTKVGIAPGDGMVYFEHFWKTKALPLEEVKRRPCQAFELPEKFDRSKIREFFCVNHPSAELFQAALRAILSDKPEYFDRPLRTPPHDSIDHEEHQRRCEALASVAQPLDMLCTFDPTSRMSRFIARIDAGPWSHTATVARGGMIFEAVTSGVRQIALTEYLQWPYRLGLYRSDSPVPDPEAGEVFMQGQLGKPYAFGKATLAGLARILRLDGRKLLPNDLALLEGLHLVCRV